MNKEIQSYLNELHLHLHLDAATEEKIIKEIYYHLEDALRESQTRKFHHNKPIRDITKSLGNPRNVAKLLYEAHSRESWEGVILYLQPYILFIALFIFHLWHSFFPLLISFIFILTILLLSIRKGIENWILSWSGFLLSSIIPLFILANGFIAKFVKTFPSVLHGNLSISHWINSLNQAILPLHSSIYLFSIFIILITGGYLSVQSMYKILKYDWVPVSSILMILPLFLSWSLILKRLINQYGLFSSQVEQLDGTMIYSLLIYAISSIIFIRAPSRHIKITSLCFGAIFGVTFLIKNTIGIQSTYTFLFLSGSTGIFFFIPLLVYKVFFQVPKLDTEFLKSLSTRQKPIHHSIYQ